MSASALFKGGVLQSRYDDPEVQGGKIALISANSKTVQKPPNFLDHMTVRNQKQVAYNERVLYAEDEVAGINCDIAELCQECHLPDSLRSASMPPTPSNEENRSSEVNFGIKKEEV
jgi:hypothetical protein